MGSNDTRTRSRTVLITGGSSGIGYELSRLFAARRFVLILVARNRSRLNAVARELRQVFGSTVITVPLDLTSPSSPSRLYASLKRRHLSVDVLVNNAGVTTFGPFTEIDLAADRNLLQLNVATLTETTKLFVRDMVVRGSGKILNVASAGAFQPGPFRATYFASKAYVLSFTEALAAELKGTGVTVSALCPGPTATGHHLKAGMKETGIARSKRLDPRFVADAGFAGMMAGRVVIIPGLKFKTFSYIVRFLPRAVTRSIVKRMHAKKSVMKAPD